MHIGHWFGRVFGTHHKSEGSIGKDKREAERRMMPYSHYTKGQQKLNDYLTKAAMPGSKEGKKEGVDLNQNPLYKQATNLLSQYLNPSQEMMKQMQAPFMRQFNEQVAPGIAQQYANAGLSNSTSFQNAMANAGSSLEERLNLQYMQAQQDALSKGLQYAQAPFQQRMDFNRQALAQQPNNYAMVGGAKNSTMMALAPAVGAGAGALAGGYFGGMPGAKVGADVGAAGGQGLANYAGSRNNFGAINMT